MDTKLLSQHSLIISDLHLSEKECAASALFFKFMADPAKEAEALYILGDFFAAWIGDDDLTPYHQKIIAALKALSDSGVKLYFMVGNRDFLVGKRFSRATGATLLCDPSVVNFYGTETLLMHGDTLCSDDIAYLRYRKIVRNRLLQKLFLLLPLHLRQKIANQLRAKSRGNFVYQDVNGDAVKRVMAQHKTPVLIHGHTHLFQVHNLADGGKRIVLGAWHDTGSYVKISPEGFNLEKFN